MEFPAAAGAEPPPVSSSQEVSTAAPEALGGDLGDQNVEAAAAAARWHLGPARARCSPARRWSRPELPPGSGERRLAGERECHVVGDVLTSDCFESLVICVAVLVELYDAQGRSRSVLPGVRPVRRTWSRVTDLFSRLYGRGTPM